MSELKDWIEMAKELKDGDELFYSKKHKIFVVKHKTKKEGKDANS
tara:strand:+ start:418 stop:552 length:135 start_codon:yes stop_codon:yes gene_type:complete